jgi:hypothetical protein
MRYYEIIYIIYHIYISYIIYIIYVGLALSFCGGCVRTIIFDSASERLRASMSVQAAIWKHHTHGISDKMWMGFTTNHINHDCDWKIVALEKWSANVKCSIDMWHVCLPEGNKTDSIICKALDHTIGRPVVFSHGHVSTGFCRKASGRTQPITRGALGPKCVMI